MTANALREVSANVTVEPLLQPLNGGNLGQAASNEDSARVDIRASGFWGNAALDAFFDVGVFYPFTPSYRNKSSKKFVASMRQGSDRRMESGY